MIKLRIASPLDVPVFDRPDDVGLVGRAELDLDFVARRRLRLGEKQI
jgi:hypothetical protein